MSIKIGSTGYWNPYLVNGRHLKNIIFYSKSGVVLTVNQGWFESGGTVKEFELPVDEVVNRRKVNFGRNEVFSVKEDLYIPAELVNLTYVEEKVVENDTYDSTHDIFTLDVPYKTSYKSGNQIELSIYVGSKDNDLGKRSKELEKQLKEDRININSYELSLLLKKYDLVKKETVS